MRKIAFILAFLAISMSFTFGQTASDTISLVKGPGGMRFYKDWHEITMNQLIMKIKPNDKAYQLLNSARSSYTWGSILAYSGGFLIGYPIGAAISGKKPVWAMAGIGAGLVLLSIPIYRNYIKKTEQAIDTYNRGLQTTSFWDKNELNFSFTENGIGVTLNF